MASYKVLSNLKHDNLEYVAGDTLTDITDVQAEELVKERVIEPTSEARQEQVEAPVAPVNPQEPVQPGQPTPGQIAQDLSL